MQTSCRREVERHRKIVLKNFRGRPALQDSSRTTTPQGRSRVDPSHEVGPGSTNPCKNGVPKRADPGNFSAALHIIWCAEPTTRALHVWNKHITFENMTSRLYPKDARAQLPHMLILLQQSSSKTKNCSKFQQILHSTANFIKTTKVSQQK